MIKIQPNLVYVSGKSWQLHELQTRLDPGAPIMSLWVCPYPSLGSPSFSFGFFLKQPLPMWPPSAMSLYPALNKANWYPALPVSINLRKGPFYFLYELNSDLSWNTNPFLNHHLWSGRWNKVAGQVEVGLSPTIQTGQYSRTFTSNIDCGEVVSPKHIKMNYSRAR